MNKALEFLGVKTQNPKWSPERRTAHFNSPSGGLNGLHRFPDNSDAERHGLKNEQPWHRMAAFMLNAGRTSSEIAVCANVTVGQVSTLRAQRWFQELCATIANNNGEELLGFIQSEAMDSINKIVNLRDHSESERVQLTAAVTLLEHARGKPTQTVISDVTHSVKKDPRQEREELLRELATISGPTTPALSQTHNV